MDISRRRFMQLTAAGAVALAAPSFAKDVPILYGDMEHDDWDAFQALLSGDPVEFLTPPGVVTIRDNQLTVTGGKFWMDMTKPNRQAVLSCRIDAPWPYPHRFITITRNSFDTHGRV